MIISHKHKFIFIKTNKTAGTSIEIALSRFCGPDDVITRNFPEEEQAKRDLGYMSARNYRVPFHKYRVRDWQFFFNSIVQRKKRKRRRYYSHSSPGVIRELAGDETWSSYYKFCFERNPWDRAVSFYYFILRENKRRGLSTPSLSEFINSDRILRLKTYGSENYLVNNTVVVDRVCLYENLEAELEYVCSRVLGIQEPLQLPHAKGQHRSDKRHYRDILSHADRDIIASRFAFEIGRFGYKF